MMSGKSSTKVQLTSEMAENHTGQNICDGLTAAVKEWEIADSQISCIVHDNAANANLGADLTGWPHLGAYLTGWPHLDYVAHELQLCIKSALEDSAIQ